MNRFALALALAASASVSTAQTLTRLNTTPAGGQTAGLVDAVVRGLALSRDGRHVAFADPNALIPGGRGIYVKDRTTGVLSCVSVASGGSIGAAATTPSISSDGRYVAFASASSTLVTGDTNGVADIFVHDRATASTARVSVSTNGSQASGASSRPVISGDGRLVAFESEAANLDPADINGSMSDVFVHDRNTGLTTLVSALPTGVSAPFQARAPQISRDGRFVAFNGYGDFDPANPGPTPAIFVRDLALATTQRASFDAAGAPVAAWFELMESSALSADGRYVLYVRLLGWNSSGLLRRDRLTGAVDVIDPSGIFGSISDDGRFVTWVAYASLTPDDVNPEEDVYLRDMALGTSRRISVELPGHISQIFEASTLGVISGDGCVIAFQSGSNDLVAGDTNDKWDYFLHDVRGVAPVLFCPAGTSSQGCVASISTAGVASGSAGSGFVITASNASGQRNAMLLYGISGRIANPWGQSVMCVAPPRQRTGVRTSTGSAGQCNGVLSLDWNTYIASHAGALGAPIITLTPTVAQWWIRDPQSSIGSVLSNAVEFYACP